MFSLFIDKFKDYLFPSRVLSDEQFLKFKIKENKSKRPQFYIICAFVAMIHILHHFYFDKVLDNFDGSFFWRYFRISVALVCLSTTVIYVYYKDFQSSFYKLPMVLSFTYMLFAQTYFVSIASQATVFMPYFMISVIILVLKLSPLANIVIATSWLVSISIYLVSSGKHTTFILSYFFTIFLLVIFISFTKKNRIDMFKENNNLQTKLQKNNKFLTQTYQQLIHDVKSPLTALKLLSEKEENNKSSSLLRMATERVEGIIKDIEFAKSIDTSSFNVKEVIDYIVMEIGCNGVVTSDLDITKLKVSLNQISKNMFSRVISNLINNAVEATGDLESKIDISIKIDNNFLIVTIRDYGPGVPEDVINLVLNRGYTTKKKGMGYGLSHASDTISNNEGEFSLTNDNGLSVELKMKLV